MERATLNQAEKVLAVFSDGDISAEHLQRIIASGFLADLRDSTIFPDRDVFRHLLGLPPLEKPQLKEECSWPTWRTLTVTLDSREQLLSQLVLAGFVISSAARQLIHRGGTFGTSFPYELPLVRLRVEDLGFREDPNTKELFIHARRHGLYPCPGEIGPCLALALGSQLEGLLWVASKVYNEDHVPHCFCLDRDLDGQLRLTARPSTDRISWPVACKVIFCKA